MYKLIKKLFGKSIQKDIDEAIDELRVELKKQAVLECLAKKDSATEVVKKKVSQSSLRITFNDGNMTDLSVKEGDERMLNKLISAQFNDSPILWYGTSDGKRQTVHYFRKSDIRSMKLSWTKED